MTITARATLTQHQMMHLVVDVIKETDTYLTQEQVYGQVSAEIPYTTFSTIMRTLEQQNKIMYDQDGAIIWIEPSGQAKSIQARTTRYI